jgi:RNA polymerase sigma-70 factor (ECF subfamily)
MPRNRSHQEASMPQGPRLVYSRKSSRKSSQEWLEAEDREVLLGIRAGDEVALAELVRRKTQPLTQVAYRVLGDLEEARDVVQVTFLKIWNHREKYDLKWAPNTWIYRITTNLAIDTLRSRKSRDRVQEPFKNHIEHRESGKRLRATVARVGQAEISHIFDELAELLTEKQRLVFVLRELEGLSSKEVAKVADCRESTVRNHLFNARKILRKALIERYPEYAAVYAEKYAEKEDPS